MVKIPVVKHIKPIAIGLSAGVLALAPVVPAFAATAVPAYVQSATGASSASFSSATAAGDAVVVLATWTGGATSPTLAGTAGDASYTAVSTPTQYGTAYSQLFYATGLTGGSDTITATYTGETGTQLLAAEYSGVAAGTADASAGQAYVTGLMSPQITTTNSSDLLVAGFASTGSITGSGSDGFTTNTTTANGMLRNRAVAAGTYTADANQSGSNGAGLIVALKANPNAPAAPGSPSLGSGGTTTTNTTPLFSGSCQAGTVISLFIDGVLSGSASCTASLFGITLSAGLSFGLHVATVSQSDSNGASTQSPGLDFTVAQAVSTPGAPNTGEARQTVNWMEPAAITATITAVIALLGLASWKLRASRR